MSVIYDYPVQYPRHEAALKEASSSTSTPAASTAKLSSGKFLVSNAAPAGGQEGLFGADGLTFKDVVDAVNPLQQLPLIGSLYRNETGDSMSLASRLAGGAILGGPLGLVMAAAGSIVEAITGGDAVEHAVAMFGGSDTPAKRQYVMKAYTRADSLG